MNKTNFLRGISLLTYLILFVGFVCLPLMLYSVNVVLHLFMQGHIGGSIVERLALFLGFALVGIGGLGWLLIAFDSLWNVLYKWVSRRMNHA